MARVLVVDDVKFISMMLADILRKAGHKVDVASNGREAIDKADVETPDLVVLDVSMPEVDGIEVTRTLRATERTRDVPVLMVTARTDEKTRAAAVEAGANDYVVKPFEASSLLRKVAALLEESGSKRARVPTVSSILRIVAPGVEVEDNPKALVVKLKLQEISPELFEALEPEITNSTRGVLISWRSPETAPAEVIDGFAKLAARMAAERRALRIANAPEGIVEAFEKAGLANLLLGSKART
jgi:DNA-binding response OmpR family regulator